MSDEPGGTDRFEEHPACPSCGSYNVERTPAMHHDYQCINCGHEFDEGGRGVIIE